MRTNRKDELRPNRDFKMIYLLMAMREWIRRHRGDRDPLGKMDRALRFMIRGIRTGRAWVR